ncbi:SDR family oxidoreductase [Shewanella yunxiaonensis]|uniref:SDR family oxidoreductase n=1 Tax=Shewanella yunxiaonensis TaxID=2829809 RepID=A0ABX7YVT2_9GAMM|nr:SDR family oxidoreductase [Shewanella yunxiaonensis]QUN06900.1 SDR family oxidoreductase [Shewanella yunxiaonensis]
MANDLLKNKNVIVTGASSGIGRVVAQVFSRQGARIIAVGRDLERLDQTVSSLVGTDNLSIVCDVSKPTEIENLFQKACDFIGQIDSVVHCAGIQKTLPLQALKESDFDEIFDTNVKSAQFIAKSFRKNSRYNKDGSSLIFLSSVASICGEPAISAYSASKSALLGLSRSIASELARNNIRVNCISPGVVITEMAEKLFSQLTSEQYQLIKNKHMLGFGKPEDVANAALYLASDLAIWVTGSTLYVDGGYSAQ